MKSSVVVDGTTCVGCSCVSEVVVCSCPGSAVVCSGAGRTVVRFAGGSNVVVVMVVRITDFIVVHGPELRIVIVGS